MLTAIFVKNSWELLLVLRTKENNVFTEFLLDVTIWDGGKKEISDATSHFLPKFKIKKSKMKTKNKIK